MVLLPAGGRATRRPLRPDPVGPGGGSARSGLPRGDSAWLSAGLGSLTAGGQKARLSMALEPSNVSSLSGLPTVPVAVCWAASPVPIPSLSRLIASLLSQLTHTGRLFLNG